MSDARRTRPRPEDPSQDLLHARSRPLDAIFRPHRVAVIGASEEEGSVGRSLVENLLRGAFQGDVIAVNPKRESVLGLRAYDAIGDVPGQVDLAVIATPARTVPGVVRECVRTGVPGGIVITAGFRETGEAGMALEQEILAEARKGPMRLIGPNCLGVMVPPVGLNATFAHTMAEPGGVAFVSQSGAMLTAILDWSRREGVGFSAVVSAGSMLDVGWGDLISYLGRDSKTESILLYMESVGEARAFLSAAREVGLQKPIIVIKSGRSEAAAKAAASHTGTLAGSDSVLSAAFARVGVLRVDAIADLFYLAEALAKQPRPKGDKLTIITNAGGPGVIATDALDAAGAQLADLSDATRASLDAQMPAHASSANPVDVLGDADADRFTNALKVMAEADETDGILVTVVPVGTINPARVAEGMAPFARKTNKTILASWMGGPAMSAGEEILNRAGIPTFNFPDTAARIFGHMARYSRQLEALYEVPAPTMDAEEGGSDLDLSRAQHILDEAERASRTLLTEAESKQLLAAYGIPTTRTLVAQTPDEAVAHADDIGYPVVVKLHSYTITHKVDVGGVQLDLEDEAAVREAFDLVENGVADAGHPDAFDGVAVQPMIEMGGYELILGASPDQQFGPVMLFGSGGSLVEVYKDRALGLPPLTTTLARRMMEGTKVYEALHGIRGRDPVDLAALETLLVRFSHLVVDQPRIKEIEINPLLASPEGLLALDARVILYEDGEERTQPAIRPYPRDYTSTFEMRSGDTVEIRPIRPEDETLLVDFHEGLSEESVYLRYADTVTLGRRVAHERLSRLAFIDYDREMALVAVEDGEIQGVGRLTYDGHDPRSGTPTGTGTFALIVRDTAQGQGLGTELLKRLLAVGEAERLEQIQGEILNENDAMQKVAGRLGFTLAPAEGTVHATRRLG